MKTHAAFCIDESGSVKGIIEPLVRSYNQTVIDIRNSVLDEGQEASMTALAFGDHVLKHRVLYVGEQVQTVKQLSYKDFRPSGMTPLFDSIFRAIQKLTELDDGDENTTFVVTVVTDGYENSSKDPGIEKTLELIQEKEKSDRWTFTFMIPHEYIADFLRTYPMISQGNVQSWDAKTETGVKKGFAVSSRAYAGYFKNKSAGIKSTRSFYSDLSDLTVRSTRTGLSKITKQVDFITSPNECTIREVVENAGKKFVKGSAFYHLIKTEKRVQPYKLVALRVKSSGEVYCGKKARTMLGIDVDRTVRLVPGDHGKFDVFIQSTSHNRKIPARSEVMYWPKVGTQQK